MRAKWSAPIRKYWKISEQMMVKYCDLTICDSVNIEKYIHFRFVINACVCNFNVCRWNERIPSSTCDSFDWIYGVFQNLDSDVTVFSK